MISNIDLGEIIDSFELEEFKAAMAKSQVFDFLPTIYTNQTSDMAALKKWVTYLKSVNSPYVVIPKNKKAWMLWKIQRCDENGFWL